MAENEIKKILVIRLSALGDTIHTLPGVSALRDKFPDAQIDWVVEDKASKFIENNPLINNVYVINRKNFNIKSFFELISKLREQKYDAALDFQQLLKSGLVLGFCGAKRRITLDKGREFSGLFANEIKKTEHKLFDLNYHVVKRNLDLAAVLGCDTGEIKFVLPDFSAEYSGEIKNIVDNIDKTKKTIVIAPATTWDNKHWTTDGWRDVINEFKDNCNIIVTAAQKEKIVTKNILDNIEGGSIIDLTGKTNLADLVYIYKNSDIVISPDSGSAHIAWATGIPHIITLFFATSKARTAPFGDKYYSVSAKCQCSPCMKKKCNLKSDINACTKTINSEEIINIVKKVLQEPKKGIL